MQKMDDVLRELFDANEALFHVLFERRSKNEAEDIEEEGSPERIAFETAMIALRRGVVCPEWAARAVVGAWGRFESFQVKTLGAAFGIEDNKNLRANQNRRLVAAVYSFVQELRNENIPLKSNQSRKGALELAGERFHMSASDVEKKVREWRELCEANGSDPDAKPFLADARCVMVEAFCEALLFDPVNSKTHEEK